MVFTSRSQRGFATTLKSYSELLLRFPRVECFRSEVVGRPSYVYRPSLVKSSVFSISSEKHRVLVHPGYFFEFPEEAFIVCSLIPEPEVFAAGVARLINGLGRAPVTE